MAKTVLWKPSEYIIPRVTVFDRRGFKGTYTLEGLQKLGRYTPKRSPDIALFSIVVSREHGEFGVVDGRCFYRDVGSKNGTWINDRQYGAKDGARELKDGDVFTFRGADGDELSREEMMLFTTGDRRLRRWEPIPLRDNIAGITVGRGNGSLQLKDETVSERHAAFFHASKGWYIMDCASKNGVFLNQKKVAGNAPLHPLDVVRIGDVWFVYTEEALWVGRADVKSPSAALTGEGILPSGGLDMPRPEDSQGDRLCIDIEERNVWKRFKKKTLLRDIHITVEQGDMVLILGGSGAGKTTFMNAVMGYEKAEGTVVYGDRDIYEEYEHMKYEIGFVPQQDLLRDTDTVEDTLRTAARMRMPAKSTADQQEKRVNEVLELMGLGPERQSLVSKLSGGQRKRLSIAVEFMGDPKLFFLDEPDSGLDGVMARTLMANLRKVAGRGKIVMVITHGPDRVAKLFNKVVVLAKSQTDNCGYLAFYGTIEEAYRFFSTDSLEGVVKRINRRDEGGEGRADEYIERYRKRMENGN